MFANIGNHGPHSKEIDVHGSTKGFLEPISKLDPSFVLTLVEAVSKGDLLIVVPWQQANLVAGEVRREVEFRLALLGPDPELESLPCAVVQPGHVRCRRHERILIQNRQSYHAAIILVAVSRFREARNAAPTHQRYIFCPQPDSSA